MKVNYKQLALITAVATAVVYASNNDVPLLGNAIRRRIG